MALSIIFEDDSVAYMDAVTTYSKSKASSVSTHPVDLSSLVTDHVLKENPNFNFRAIISSADFNTTYTRPVELIEGGEGNPPISPEQNAPVSSAVISSPSTLLDYLPGSIGQILGNTITSDVSVDPFRGFTHEMVRDRFLRAWDNSEVLTLVDYDFDISFGRYISARVVENCIMTRFEDTESVETGDALVANISLQQVRFATIKEVDVNIDQEATSSGTSGGKPTDEETSDQASSVENKGDVTDVQRVGESRSDTLVRIPVNALRSIGIPEELIPFADQVSNAEVN